LQQIHRFQIVPAGLAAVLWASVIAETKDKRLPPPIAIKRATNVL
jgi:hypothetical protein